jgi:processive 1,2-diacylglycerol beta-glucosyltransferase
MKKILIVYGSIGLGHKVAAESIAAALAKYPGVEILMLDVLEMYKGRLVHDFSKFYNWAIDKMPGLWGFIYTNKIFHAGFIPF